jgi:hypothetical protein
LCNQSSNIRFCLVWSAKGHLAALWWRGKWSIQRLDRQLAFWEWSHYEQAVVCLLESSDWTCDDILVVISEGRSGCVVYFGSSSSSMKWGRFGIRSIQIKSGSLTLGLRSSCAM